MVVSVLLEDPTSPMVPSISSTSPSPCVVTIAAPDDPPTIQSVRRRNFFFAVIIPILALIVHFPAKDFFALSYASTVSLYIALFLVVLSIYWFPTKSTPDAITISLDSSKGASVFYHKVDVSAADILSGKERACLTKSLPLIDIVEVFINEAFEYTSVVTYTAFLTIASNNPKGHEILIITPRHAIVSDCEDLYQIIFKWLEKWKSK